METQPYARQMQDEMIAEIEAARPEFLVVVRQPQSWLHTRTSDKHIFEWSDGYVEKNYKIIGVADIQSSRHTEYRWGQTATDYKPSSAFGVFVFRRKT